MGTAFSGIINSSRFSHQTVPRMAVSKLAKAENNDECQFCKEVSEAEKKPYVLTRTGRVLIAVSGTVFVGFFAVTTPFFLPALRRVCLPYVPATTQQVRNVMTALHNHPKGRLVDLGSGDGRIVSIL